MGRARHLYLLFFLSGISGLVYESIWSRYLRLFVGSAATAQILVLALFMGGMSLGALIIGKRSERVKRPVLAYGIIEGAIGLYAFAFPFIFEFGTRLCYDVLFPAVGAGAGVGIFKWLVAALFILPPCLFLGMTFPLMSVGILRKDRARSGEILSYLYFSNSFGAAIGAMVSGFLLVPKLGLPMTLVAAGVLNLVILAVAVRERQEDAPLTEGALANAGAIEAEQGARTDGDDAGETALPVAAAPKLSPTMVRLFLAVAAGTGLSSFMYEVSWIRLLSMVLGSATHSFEVMLSAFVFGLALGGLWVRRRMDEFDNPALVLAGVQIIMGMAAIATLPLYRVAVQAMGAVFYQDERTQGMWILFNVVRYLLSLLIMLPATFCAGMTLPLITHVLLKRGASETVVGRVYGVNTLGAIAGAVVGGLVLMPLISLKGVIILGAAVDMVLGVAIIRQLTVTPGMPRGLPKLMRNAAVGSLGILSIAVFVIELDPMVLSASVFRKGQVRLHEDYDLVSHVDGRTATVTVITDTEREGYYTIFTNGKPDASVWKDRWPEYRDPRFGPNMTGDEPTQFLIGMFPLLHKPHAERWAMIGMGSGVSSHTVLSSPELESLTTIEIEREMARGAEVFKPLNSRIYEDPRSTLVFDDAKAFFAGAGDTYDVILSEPSNPWVSGVSSLFTVEFYQEVKRYLAEGGMLGQWIHGYELSDELLFSVLAALDQEFSDYVVYRCGSRDWVIVAVPEGTVPPAQDLPLDWAEFREGSELMGVHEFAQFQTLMIANKAMLHPFLADKTPNTDARPILDNGAERSRFFRDSAEALLALRWTPLPLLEVFGGLERLPYPDPGMRDDREDKHVLQEPEKAIEILRDFDAPLDEQVGVMRIWTKRTEELEPQQELWDAWYYATYEVFNLTASWVDLRSSDWWGKVLQTQARPDCPADVFEAVALLDAALARDAEAIEMVVTSVLSNRNPLLDPRLTTLVGAMGLVLADAPLADRRAFATEHMGDLGNEGDSDDLAYQIIRSYMQQ